MKKIVRRGFTLPEVLVTVTVVAVLAAVVVPAVTQYASKGDAPSTKADISQLVTAVSAFTSDVRKYPGSLLELTTAIKSSDVTADQTTVFSKADSSKWKGPYTPSVFTASGFATISGLQVEVGPTIKDSANWLLVPIRKISGQDPDCSSMATLDGAVDGPNTGASSGQIVWFGPTTSGVCVLTPGTAFVRLIPSPAP
jgi:prepilin-type N-terminal cleavage/methylation domain-containing protein